MTTPRKPQKVRIVCEKAGLSANHNTNPLMTLYRNLSAIGTPLEWSYKDNGKRTRGIKQTEDGKHVVMGPDKARAVFETADGGEDWTAFPISCRVCGGKWPLSDYKVLTVLSAEADKGNVNIGVRWLKEAISTI